MEARGRKVIEKDKAELILCLAIKAKVYTSQIHLRDTELALIEMSATMMKSSTMSSALVASRPTSRARCVTPVASFKDNAAK